MTDKAVTQGHPSGSAWRDELKWKEVVERYNKDKKLVSPLEIALVISKMNTTEELAAGRFGRYWRWTLPYKDLLGFSEAIQRRFGPEFPLGERLVVDDIPYIKREKTEEEKLQAATDYQKMRARNKRRPFASKPVSDFDKA